MPRAWLFPSSNTVCWRRWGCVSSFEIAVDYPVTAAITPAGTPPAHRDVEAFLLRIIQNSWLSESDTSLLFVDIIDLLRENCFQGLASNRQNGSVHRNKRTNYKTCVCHLSEQKQVGSMWSISWSIQGRSADSMPISWSWSVHWIRCSQRRSTKIPHS
jgi:hypothetical protein